jgi:EAL domain-containing protein (putative c-di-GMP-specific phosphodiesterase class I)/GGDEF domain-containing protein/CheY-like chemotaxis protein
MPVPAVKVLLVEDSPADALLFRETLGREDAHGRTWDIAHVSSLDDARRSLRDEAFDVAVLDLDLPGTAGLDTLDALAASVDQTPIVVLSGLGDEHVAMHAVRRGAQDYLVKGTCTGPALADALTGAIAREWAESELAHLDSFHPQTGLPRRGLLERRVGAALGRANLAGASLPLLHVELDGLEAIAAVHGAPVADALRGAATRRLSARLTRGDTLGHPGEHGLAVVAESVRQGAQAATLATRLLDAVACPFTVDGQRFVTGGRVGIGLLPADGSAPAEALANARAAALRAEPGTFAFCDAEMTELTYRRHALLADLPTAIRAGELVLHFQPIVSPETGEVSSVEALLRWQHPQLGLISPGEFIPLAEDSDLIVELGEWALRAACWQLRAWDRAGMAPIGMAVNVSPRQFASPNLVPTVEQALSACGIAAERLELEVTESTLADPDRTMGTLSALGRLGVRVAIDDFGTGYASLAYLRKFRAEGDLVHTIKIDRSFVADLGEDEHAGGIVTAILGLARGLDLRTVGEGVETERQAGFLREQGCDDLQGFRICRPLPTDEASAWLGTHALV